MRPDLHLSLIFVMEPEAQVAEFESRIGAMLSYLPWLVLTIAVVVLTLAVLFLWYDYGPPRDDFACGARIAVLAALSHPSKDNLYVTPRVEESVKEGWCNSSEITMVLAQAFPTKGLAYFRVSCKGVPRFVARYLGTKPVASIAIDPLSDYAKLPPLPQLVCTTK
jgi:hypothetical protein